MIFSRTDTLRSPRRMVLYARDTYRNSTVKELYLRFDAKARPKSGLRLIILVPPDDITVYTVAAKRLHGVVEHVSGDSIAVKVSISVNGGPAQTVAANGRGSADWYADVLLDSPVNYVSATALNKEGDTVATAQRYIGYTPGAVDTQPPIIVAVRIQGENANGLMVDKESVVLRVIAFDAGEGIAALLVNGTATASAGALVWDVPAALAHRSDGTVFSIEARDRAGLTKDTSVVVYTNHAPVIEHAPVPPFPLPCGVPFIDSVVVRDPDGDPISYSLAAGTAALRIDGRGIIRWTPETRDTGKQVFALRIFDGYEEVLFPVTIVVVDKADLRPAVAFLTGPDDFPQWLEVVKDTLRLQLQTIPETGSPPLSYRVTQLADGRSFKADDGMFRFIPAMEDTGVIRWRITVTDTFNRADTFYTSLIVVPPNRQCHVRRIDGFDTIADGSYDLSDPDYADTLVLRIEDPDIDRVEQFDAFVRRNGKEERLLIDGNRRCAVPLISSDRASGFDTLKVVVNDRVLHRDSLEFNVYYGAVPQVPTLLYPLSDTLITDSTVGFSWNGGDPDGKVYYSLLIGVCPGPLEIIAQRLTGLSLSGVTLPTSGRYCWQVVASDGKADTRSESGTFINRAPGHVRFATREADIGYAYEALRDSLVVPLEVAANTGRPPFTFGAMFVGNSRLLTCSDGVVRYLPQVEDTGTQEMMFTVKDAVGNADTLSPTIFITPPNRPCSLAVFHHGDYLSQSTVDMSAALQPDTIVFSIIDPDTSLTERHTVTVVQLNTESKGTVDIDRLIGIVLDPQKANRECDTVKVYVEDRAGHSASAQRIIYYGVN